MERYLSGTNIAFLWLLSGHFNIASRNTGQKPNEQMKKKNKKKTQENQASKQGL